MSSRQEIGRAALRTLSSHKEEDERQHHSSQAEASIATHSAQHDQILPQHSNAPSIGKSYFGGNALQITDSPSTSPVLSAMTFDRYEGRPRSIMQRRRGRYGGDGEGASTPGTNDVPSLSLSNSSFSDGPLRSPFTEQAPSHISVSSNRTLMQLPRSATTDADRQLTSASEAALRRVASHLRMPVEDVRRVHRCMSLDDGNLGFHQDRIIDDIGRETYDKIAQAFRFEEERLPHYQSSYLRTDSMHSEADLQHPRSSYASFSSSRYTPLSPTAFTHDDLDFLDRSGPIPSPRVALEMLIAGNSTQQSQPLSPHSPTAPFDANLSRPYPAYQQGQHPSRSPYDRHSRHGPGGSRVGLLPDRSYHSMDDYSPQSGLATTSPLMRGDNALDMRKSIHSVISSPVQQSVISRQASRSPLIESPTLLEDEIMDIDEPREAAKESPVHLRPGPFSPKQRSASTNLPDGVDVRRKASRRASAEVLSRSVKRAASPLQSHREGSFASNDNISIGSSQKISHAEVMARLQRKVKERLAARGALDISTSNVLIGGRSGSAVKSTRSPGISKHMSLPYGANTGSVGRSAARRVIERPLDSSTNTLPTRRSGFALERPHKSNSLRGISQEKIDRQPVEGRREVKMEEDVCDNDNTAGMGIEALLSAAAIADNR